MDRKVKGNKAVKTDERRREALKRIGKFAAYTAPAMMVLAEAESHACWCNTPNCSH